ncbi:hypothetical protein [Hamadaea tsunoensis]|uniref:hypothetical protein n=1 Tax=Hamadaea tsunoensis TaxID=53368 RepID=UPI0004285C0B|nr:hypothetical protein [Hamadaea tsunoensis]
MSALPARDDARISGPGDVARALSVVRERAAQRGVTADLRQPVGLAVDETVRETVAVSERVGRLLPGGLPAGATVAIGAGQGATSLLVAVLGQATSAGKWVGVVGVPQLGLEAVAEAGADLERLALVPNPGVLWADVVAALCDGLALVVVAAPVGAAERTLRALSARARKSGCVLLPFGGSWPGADLVLEPAGRRWHMPARRRLPCCFDLDVTVRGRGAAARPRTETVHLPESVPVGECPAATMAARPRPALRLADAADLPLDPADDLRTLVR